VIHAHALGVSFSPHEELLSPTILGFLFLYYGDYDVSIQAFLPKKKFFNEKIWVFKFFLRKLQIKIIISK